MGNETGGGEEGRDRKERRKGNEGREEREGVVKQGQRNEVI